jgi:hypothetical protein
MNPDPNDFEALLKLMALKRHEQPPPGYFSRLPDTIAARLERGEGQLGFWETFMDHLTFRPAFVYSFSLAALGALTISVIYSVRVQPEESAQMAGNNSYSWQSAAPEQGLASPYDSSQPLHVANWMGSDNVSNPAPAMPSLFDTGAHGHPMPVSFAGSP